MAFEKGQSGNPTGRKPGTLNNATTTAREAISAALDKATASRLAAALDSLTGKEYIDAYVKLAEFVTPKLQRMALATGEGIVKVLTTSVLVRSSGIPLAYDEKQTAWELAHDGPDRAA